MSPKKKRGQPQQKTPTKIRTAVEGEVYGVVLQMLGNSRMRVYCFDGKVRMGRIRGKLVKRMWIREEDIVILSPWEFEDEVGSSKFIGIITDVYVSTHFRQSSEKENEYLIIHLARPFVYNKLKNEYFICSPRHEGNGLRELAKGGSVSFNFYRASSERAKSETPFDL